MQTPTSEPDANLEGLSEAQKQLIEQLREAGPNGIETSRYYSLATSLGIDAFQVKELYDRGLTTTKTVGHTGYYILPDFSQ